MSHLDDLITGVLKREGGYSNNPNDAGGPTKHGITLAVLREWRNDPTLTAQDVEDLTATEARQIYEARYWYTPGFHRVAAISKPVAEELLDTGVNMGQGTAVQFLQRVLTAFNCRGQHYPDLKVDGVLGSKTLHALQSYLRHRLADGERVLLFMLNGVQAYRYMEIVERREQDEEFIYGQVLHRAAAGWGLNRRAG